MGDEIGSGLRVLVLDDDPAMLRYLAEALVAMRFTVTTARSIAEVRARCAGETFDLFLLDQYLPDGSGLALARNLSRHHPEAEIVLLSGYANFSAAVEAIQSQVADYFIKPVDPEDLRARLQRIVEGQALKRTNRTLLEELRRNNEVLESLATRDPLTTLFNHAHFQDSVLRELARSRRHNLCCAVLLLDIDGFRRVNEIAGHARGDAVLRALGALLSDQCRRSDLLFHLSEQDLAARYGGDRFALLLPQTTKSGAAAKGETLRQAVGSHDFGIPGGVPLTLSIGVAGCPEDATSREDLLAAAQIGLAAAKSAGGNRIICYAPSLARSGQLEPAVVQLEVARLAALDRTIAARAFQHLYQPIVDAQTFDVFAHEALCQPSDPAFRSPVELFAAAERAGRIAALGQAVRSEALRPMADLPEPCLLFLNLQVQEFLNPGLLEAEPVLLPWARRLVFEITESSRIHDFRRARERILELRGQGFRVALDDLGAGYSGLNNLALLAPDFVKLDIAMVRNIQSDSRCARLIKHLLEFCRGEGLTVIAEGIETAEEHEVVAALGVPLVQGYYFARPAPWGQAPRSSDLKRLTI